MYVYRYIWFYSYSYLGIVQQDKYKDPNFDQLFKDWVSAIGKATDRKVGSACVCMYIYIYIYIIHLFTVHACTYAYPHVQLHMHKRTHQRLT